LRKNGIIAVLLAAGKSKRMKENKLVLPLGGTTIGNMALQNAIKSELDHIIVVTREGDSLDWIDSALCQTHPRNRWTPITCLDAEKGQSHSVRCGLMAAEKLKPKGVMILLADQPFLSIRLINDLILIYGEHCKNGKTIPFLAACYQGVPRPPIIFSAETFPKLMQLKGDEGARNLLQNQKLAGVRVEYENAWDFLDIDTKDEYERITGGGTKYD
jgi:molybdenum cofactor cytidylyltransferase